MNSTIVEYIEGIEVIKAFGRAGVSYEKYAKAITDYRTFVIKWLSSTWVTMKLAFALFPATLIGTLPVSPGTGIRRNDHGITGGTRSHALHFDGGFSRKAGSIRE